MPNSGRPALQDALHHGDGWSAVAGSPGPLEKNTPSGFDRVDVLDGGGGGQDVHLDAALGHPVRGHALDAEVDGGDGEPLRRRSPGRRTASVVATSAERSAPFICGGLADLGRACVPSSGERLAGEDADAHGAALAQVAGERAGVDAADADDALRDQLVVQRAPRAPVGRDARGVAHDVAGDPDPLRLGVLVVDAGVADVRGGHRRRPGGGTRGRSGSPGSRSCRWRTPPRRRSPPRPRRRGRGRSGRPPGRVRREPLAGSPGGGRHRAPSVSVRCVIM